MKTIDADAILAVPVQISRLLHADDIVLGEPRAMARLAANSGDDGSNDLIVSERIRRNELQVWAVSAHVVHRPLTIRGRDVRGKILAVVHGVRSLLGIPARAAEGRASFDCAAGCEFVDDRLRLRE